TWSNAGPTGTPGTLRVNGGTVNLGGRFTTADFNAVVRTGGAVTLTGALENTGNTLALTGATGSLTLAHGSITGGVITTAGAARLVANSSSLNTLSGVQLDGILDLTTATAASVKVTHGMTVNGTVLLGNAGG